MADSKITGLTELSAAPSAGDLLLLVDVSDTTMAATGTNKKFDATRLVAHGGTADITTLTVTNIKSTSASTGTVTLNTPTASIPLLDIVGGGASRLAVRATDVITDATTKQARYVGRHYTNAEEDVMLFYCNNNVSSNQISIGGNSSLFNSATLINFLCGATNTTVTGTEILRLTASLAYFSVPIYGSLSSGGSLTLSSTTHATKGKIYLGPSSAYDEATTSLGINITTPSYRVDVVASAGAQNIARFGQTGISNGLAITSNGSIVSATMTGNLDVTGTLGSTWTGLSFFSGWTNVGGAYTGGGYKKIGDMVFLRGLVARASGVLLTIATLPPGYRPTAKQIFSVTSDYAFGQVTIDSDGVITLNIGTAGASVSLSGISFSTL